MPYTHLFDLLLKFLALVGAIFLVISFGMNGWIFFLLILPVWFAGYLLLLRTLGSWLYSRIYLKMDLSWSDAKQLNEAFSPVNWLDQKWLPLKEVRLMPKESRPSAALQALDTWKEDRRRERSVRRKEFNDSPLWLKSITVLLVIGIVYLFIATIAQWPPSTYIILIYCDLLDTEHYSVLLVWVFQVILLSAPFGLVKAFFKRTTR